MQSRSDSAYCEPLFLTSHEIFFQEILTHEEFRRSHTRYYLLCHDGRHPSTLGNEHRAFCARIVCAVSADAKLHVASASSP